MASPAYRELAARESIARELSARKGEEVLKLRYELTAAKNDLVSARAKARAAMEAAEAVGAEVKSARLRASRYYEEKLEQTRREDAAEVERMRRTLKKVRNVTTISMPAT